MSANAVPNKYEKKDKYVTRLMKHFREVDRIMITLVDNVRSLQFQKIRAMLRGKAEIVMGKNSLMKRAVRLLIKSEGRSDLNALLPYLKRNVGIVFVYDTFSLREVKKIFENETVGAPAKAGQTAQCDVVLPAGPTGLEPTMTSFLQAVGISSKIVKSQIDIVSDTVLFRKGERVGASAAMLCLKMKIMPFKYGLEPVICYEDRSLFDPSVLDITEDAIFARFSDAVNTVASISLAAGYPTAASVPHSFNNAFKNVLAVAVATEYSFPAAEEIKKLLSDPDALAKLQAAAATAAPAGAKAAEKKEVKKEEKKEEEEAADFGGGNLFGGEGEEW